MSRSRFWISDSASRILGPLTLEALRELVVSGQIKDIIQVRKDSGPWQRPEDFPEIAASLALAIELPGLRVAQIRSWLAHNRGRPAHEVFGVKGEASLDQYRTVYFRMVKSYHPSRLPAHSPAELRGACLEMFQFLGGLMVEVEKANETGTPTVGFRAADAKNIPVATPANSKTSKQRPIYGPEEFVGIAQGPDSIQATVTVTHQNIGMFTEHALVNLSTQGVFLPTSRPIPLGTLLEIRFVFENSLRQIKARGRVVWENLGVTSMTRGLGVRFLGLDKADQVFIQNFVRRGTQSAASSD